MADVSNVTFEEFIEEKMIIFREILLVHFRLTERLLF